MFTFKKGHTYSSPSALTGIQFRILSVIVAVFLIGFGCGGDSSISIKRSAGDKGGWVNKNTFRITGEGRPVESISNAGEKKKSAQKAALLNARFKLKIKFLGERAKSKTSIIQKVINNGRIIYRNFDVDGNCQIVYEVNHKNLRKLVKK